MGYYDTDSIALQNENPIDGNYGVQCSVLCACTNGTHMAFMALNPAALTFSGHETFVLRSNWLKKAYDLLQEHSDLFFLEDAFVRLGVGKNMAQSIRFWGRACNIFERLESGTGHRATALGRAIFDDTHGWDPFLVTPTSRWLLHWQLVSRPEATFTFYYTFNLLRRGEFTAPQLAQQIAQTVAQLGGKPPSPATISRDIDCLFPRTSQSSA